MGKASSAKKVARAAAIGESSRTSDRRQLGYPLAVAATMIFGIALVVFAAASRDSVPEPTLSDHWHDAYSIYSCETGGFEGALQGTSDPDGIHSHQDSLIHVHPFTGAVTGAGAKMEVFFNAMGVEMTNDTLTLPTGVTFTEGSTQCDGEDAVLQILRWTDGVNATDGAPDEIITENFNDVRYLANGEAFTIAFAPLGADIPAPESIPRLATVNPSLVEPNLGEDLIDLNDLDADAVDTSGTEDTE
jgi:hypothetical protein